MNQTSTEALCRKLHSRSHETVLLLEQLVNVNSHTRNVAGVVQVANLIKSALADCSLTLSTHQQEQLGEHLCFSTKAAHGRRSILLIGHHDTVFPQGSFEGFHRGADIARGPGVLDMKGGLAIVISVLQTLNEAGLLETLPVRFISVSDEEIGSPTSQAWLRELARNAQCALVFEAGRPGDAIVTARRGSGSALVTAHGKAAHAGNALLEGKNAIWALARFVDLAQQLNGSIAGASLNVGLVRGGSARNTVPDLAHCELDLRFSDKHGQEALAAGLTQAAEAAALEGTQIEVAVTVARSPWARTEGSAALAARYGQSQLEAGLLVNEVGLIGGGSDANTVGALGVPTIDGLGPRGLGFHTREEHIEVASLALKAEALLRFLLSEPLGVSAV